MYRSTLRKLAPARGPNRWLKTFVLSGSVLTGALQIQAARAEDVDSMYVLSGTSEGQAILHLSGGRCFAILPTHLLCRTCTLTGTLSGGFAIQIQKLTDQGSDVSIAEIADGFHNCKPLEGDTESTKQIYNKPAYVQRINAAGHKQWLMGRIEAQTSTHYTFLASDDGRLGEGDSGAAVLIGENVIGQLQSATDEGRRGLVIINAHLVNIIRSYLEGMQIGINFGEIGHPIESDNKQIFSYEPRIIVNSDSIQSAEQPPSLLQEQKMPIADMGKGDDGPPFKSSSPVDLPDSSSDIPPEKLVGVHQGSFLDTKGYPQPVWLTIQKFSAGQQGAILRYSRPRNCILFFEYGGIGLKEGEYFLYASGYSGQYSCSSMLRQEAILKITTVGRRYMRYQMIIQDKMIEKQEFYVYD